MCALLGRLSCGARSRPPNPPTPPHPPIQIERKAAIRNFEAVAHVADGIVISRGNLGLDFDSEVCGALLVGGNRGRRGWEAWLAGGSVLRITPGHSLQLARYPSLSTPAHLTMQVMALLQKRIISRCNALGKPVHITRIVDTMVATPRPTRAGQVRVGWGGGRNPETTGLSFQWRPSVTALRLPSPKRLHRLSVPVPAEATDVANAVLDGVDGLLLGAETLRGGYAPGLWV